MRFAAAQIPAKIGAFSLNGEKLDELHCVALIFGQFAVLNARSHRFLHASICKAARDTTSSLPHHPRHADRTIAPVGEYAAEEQ